MKRFIKEKFHYRRKVSFYNEIFFFLIKSFIEEKFYVVMKRFMEEKFCFVMKR